jgi:hypothetical protein
MPTVDADGNAIVAAIAKFPEGLTAREPYGQHSFVGGNSFMLRLLADNTAWAGIAVPAAEIMASAERNDRHLETSATIEIAGIERQGDEVEVTVDVNNFAGHKLPTGYPTRRVWIHLEVRDPSDALIFESGGFDVDGRLLVGGDGHQAHRDVITDSDQAQVYDLVLGDSKGRATFSALAAATVLKDNRILPQGWSSSAAGASRIAPAGIAGDSNFGAGRDSVRYRIWTSASALTVRAELLYQSVPPETIDEVATSAEAAATRFVAMARVAVNTPITIAVAEDSL